MDPIKITVHPVNINFSDMEKIFKRMQALRNKRDEFLFKLDDVRKKGLQNSELMTLFLDAQKEYQDYILQWQFEDWILQVIEGFKILSREIDKMGGNEDELN